MRISAGSAESPETRAGGPMLIVGSQAGIVTALAVEDGTMRWQHTIEPPCITDVVATPDLLCVASHVDHHLDGDQPAWLTALRARDGSLLWQHALSPLAGGVHLVLAGELVVASAEMGDESIWAFQLQTGKHRWTYGLSAGLWRRLRWKYGYWATWGQSLWMALTGRTAEGWLMGRLVAAWAETVLVSEPDPPYPPHLSALEARRGTLRWHAHQSYDRVLVTGDGARLLLTQITPEAVWSGTVLDAATGAVVATLPIQAGDQLIACADSRLAFVLAPYTQTVYALRLSDGTERWRATSVRSADPDRGGPAPNQAVVTGGVLCYTQRISQERVREEIVLDAETSQERWRKWLDAVTGPERWREWEREVIALDAETGQERWSWRRPFRYHMAEAGLVGEGNAVYLSTTEGVFALRTQDGAELWHAQPTTDLSRNLAILSPEVAR